MGKFLAIALIAAAAFAWYKGWIQQWAGEAADSGVASVRQTQRDATRMREADPAAEKK